jgi:small-conductance mechanosensitive channel
MMLMPDSVWLNNFLLPIAFILGGLTLGWVFDRFILHEIRKIAAKTKWESHDVIIRGIHGMVILWFTLAGVYGALHSVEIRPMILTTGLMILRVIVIFSVTITLVRIAVGFVDLYSRRVGGAFLTTSLFSNITRIVVFSLGLLVIFESMGISITPMLTALGVGGLAVALALQDTLSNLFAGIHIIASRKLRPGDYIKIESGDEGHVTDITWRNTTIRTFANNMVVVPNAKLSSSVVTNFFMPETRMAVPVTIGVSYASDLGKVERVTVEVARQVMNEVEGGVPGSEPFLRYHTFGDSSIIFTIYLYAREYNDLYLVKHEFVKRLHERYREVGIEIPFPIRTVFMRQTKKEDQL